MGAGNALSPEEKGKIETFTTAGWSQRRISKEIRRDKKAVLNYQRQLKSPRKKHQLGCKPKMTERMIRGLIIKARTGKFSARQLISVATNDFKVDIGVRRMQKIISNAPFIKYLKKLKAPKMSVDNKSDRVKFAHDHINKDQSFWSSIVFSDEKRFCLDGPDVYAHYWADTRLESEYFLVV